MSAKIYLSPSNQNANKFITGDTNEGAVWNDIAARLQKLLGAYDCETKMSKVSSTLSARAEEAKAWGADVYIAMHSNAAGVANAGAHGVEVYYDPNKGARTKALAQAVLDELKTLFATRGLRQSTKLIDCYNPSMPSVIGECGFHDNVSDARLILNNKDKIAQLYCNALVKFLGLKKNGEQPAPTPAPAPTPSPAPAPAPTPAPSTTSFKAGDVVRITGTKYYDGQAIPSWVRNQNWIVYSVSKDRVVINKNVDGTRAIMSPVAASSLSLVQRPSGGSKPSEKPADESKKEDTVYTVKSGDTLGAIAAKYKTTVALLAAYNGISNVNLINVGQKIKIPADADAAKKATTVEAGDLVKIIGTKYYGGKLIPNWVKSLNWYVYSAPANSDRVVINKSQDGTKAIMSPVNRKDLFVVKKA